MELVCVSVKRSGNNIADWCSGKSVSMYSVQITASQLKSKLVQAVTPLIYIQGCRNIDQRVEVSVVFLCFAR
jgi:hypothetical protein